MTTTWTISIDWDRNDNFTGTYDDVTGRVQDANWSLGAQRPYFCCPPETQSVGNLPKRNQVFDLHQPHLLFVFAMSVSRFFIGHNNISCLF